LDNYEYFLNNLKKRFTLDLYGYKRPQMERRINSLMRTLQISNYDQLVEEMSRDQLIFNRFIEHLTINVSEFFRNPAQWEVLTNKIIPMLINNNKNLKIWSAGCSTGEEPYTLSILLKEYFSQGNHLILATDFDTRVLNKAQDGLYSQKEISGVPENYLNKYLINKNGKFQVKDVLKKQIVFKKHNLLKDPFEMNFDLILCRNVVIYFTEETKDKLYRRFYNSLNNKGILFTGSTEQIIQARDIGFSSLAIFFYQKQ